MTIVGVIPARMAASRFPGKPLALLDGRPMIEHVYRRAEHCPRLNAVYLATCDREIYKAVEAFGGQALMTADTHERCTDRVAEAAHALQGADIVVNIQGDEPLIRPEAITELCDAALAAPDVPCVNLANVITDEADFRNPNQIKAVCDRAGFALYMSRQPIPTTRQWGRTRMLRQLGMIAFRRDFLEVFARLEPTPLEIAESVDMLRALEHGYRIKMVISPHQSFGVDTPEDLRVAERRLSEDPWATAAFVASAR
jgi:3-deoxy-manno-octulosonate cytidylyltransferase (CMP-KDO synthetase)